MVSKSPREKFFDDLKWECKRDPKIENSQFNHVHYDGKDIWFQNYPVGGRFLPTKDVSIGMEKLILEEIGKRDGLKLVHPRPAEVMEILASKTGAAFADNVLYDENYRVHRVVNNGIIIEKVPDGYVAREIEKVSILDRSVPSETILIDGHSTVSLDRVQEGVTEQFTFGSQQKLPKQKSDSLYFKRGFSGILPSEMLAYEESRQRERGPTTEFPGVWYLRDDRFSRENLATIATGFARNTGFDLGAYQLKGKDSKVIPVFTRENPKK